MVEGSTKKKLEDDELADLRVERIRCGLGTGAISGIACQSMAHYLLSEGQNDGETTPSWRRSCTQFTELSSRHHQWTWRWWTIGLFLRRAFSLLCRWILATAFAWALASYSKSLWLRTTLVHLSSTVSSPVTATPSLVLTHGLLRKSSLVEKDDERPWLPTMGLSSSLGADDNGSSSYEVSPEEFYGCYDMLVSYSRSMLLGQWFIGVFWSWNHGCSWKGNVPVLCCGATLLHFLPTAGMCCSSSNCSFHQIKTATQRTLPSIVTWAITI